MSDDNPTGDAPAIACRDLWMVFGASAVAELNAARAGGRSDVDVTKHLLEKGLIPAVRGVDFEVRPGELFVIMGLSSSGKSTLVRCISRLVEPTAGRIDVDGEDILSATPARMIELRRHKLGMVFQHFGLFPHMSVLDNVAFPLKMRKTTLQERRARAAEVLKLVGLSGREEAYPRELSGGQRQRVGIARSLAVDPDIWFLDEPFSALDPLIRRQLQDEFLDIQARLKKSIVFITHDIAEALKLADRIAIMRDGEIVQVGTPSEIVLNPVDDYVAEFAREVPRGRFMNLASIMTPDQGTRRKGKTANALPSSMSLEEALAHCSADIREIGVAGEDGKLVGVVEPKALVRALGSETRSAE